ncbi:MAG: parallel beta-helix domain-containing protein [Henriciella sp.]
MQKYLIAALAAALAAGCSGPDEAATPEDSVNTSEAGETEELQDAAFDEPDAPRDGPLVEIAAGDDFQTRLQTALIEAEVGSTIQLPAGTFAITDGLSLDVDGVMLTGAGQDETILDFTGQRGSGEGLLVTSDDVILQNFTIQETKGDGIKSKGADRIIYRDLKVQWLGEPDENHGAYGVYPVESTDILVERVWVRGASDAGIYVGQSNNIIVRNNLAEYNVAGIEIENSTNAEVYANDVTKNTGGILVFDLPDLPVMGGHSTRIYDNGIYGNNTRNFAPPGNIVAGVPSGTGVIIMANDRVEVSDNRFDDNQTVQVLVTAYTEPFTDPDYNPLPRNVVITGNTFDEGGENPQGILGDLAPLLGGQMPDIVWDGVTRWGDEPDTDVNLVIDEIEGTSFVNLGLGSYPLNPANAAPSRDMPGNTRDWQLEPVKLSHAE